MTDKENFFSSKPKQIAKAVIDIASEIFGDYKNLNLVMIGDLDLVKNIASNLTRLNLHPLKILNHSISFYIKKDTGKFKDLKKLVDNLFDFDVFLVGFKDGERLISNELVKSLLIKRKQRPILLVDGGLPGNIEPSVGKINNCFLFDLNDLEQFYSFFNQGKKKDKLLELDFLDDQRYEYLNHFFKKLEFNNEQIFNFLNQINVFLKNNKDIKVKNSLLKFFRSFEG